MRMILMTLVFCSAIVQASNYRSANFLIAGQVWSTPLASVLGAIYHKESGDTANFEILSVNTTIQNVLTNVAGQFGGFFTRSDNSLVHTLILKAYKDKEELYGHCQFVLNEKIFSVKDCRWKDSDNESVNDLPKLLASNLKVTYFQVPQRSFIKVASSEKGVNLDNNSMALINIIQNQEVIKKMLDLSKGVQERYRELRRINPIFGYSDLRFDLVEFDKKLRKLGLSFRQHKKVKTDFYVFNERNADESFMLKLYDDHFYIQLDQDIIVDISPYNYVARHSLILYRELNGEDSPKLMTNRYVDVYGNQQIFSQPKELGPFYQDTIMGMF